MIDVHRVQGWKAFVLLAASAFLAVVPRLFYLNTPFDRDEGAYAYVADIIQQGGMPYLDAFDHKPPGIYYFYRLAFSLFGHTVAAPRLLAAFFVAVACLFSMVIVFRLTRNSAASSVAGLILGVASMSIAYTGFAANTEIFTLPFLVGGVLLLLDQEPARHQFFWSGLLFGLGILVKQPVAVVAAAAVGFHLVRMLRTPSSNLLIKPLLFFLGCMLPLLAFAAYFSAHGAGKTFWEGAFTYNFGYLANKSSLESIRSSLNTVKWIWSHDPFTWVVGIGGFLISFFLLRGRVQFFYVVAVSLGAVVATGMGGNSYRHYFIFLLPSLAIFAGFALAVTLPGRIPNKILKGGLILLCCGVLLNMSSAGMSGKQLLETCYGNQPFYRSQLVGEYLKRVIVPGESVYIVGSEPQIYFYSGARAPSRLFYFYPLVTPTRFNESMRNELLIDLKRQLPQYVLFINHQASHFITGEKLPSLDNIFSQLAPYRLVAISNGERQEIVDDELSLRHWQGKLDPGAILVFKLPTASGLGARPTFGSLLGL